VRIGMTLAYSGGFGEAVERLRDLERAGLDIVHVAESYSFDAVSQLGYIAARTDRLLIASGILQIYTRTPSLTAMTAAGLDYVSDGRFSLGIGASGPQVVEGFHGVVYDAPLARTREVVDICRQVWRREPLIHQGEHYPIPLPAGRGTGLGKPLKLINRPVRERIPVIIAAIGPKNVELTAEIAEGWLPAFFHPGRAQDVWSSSLAAGTARRDPALGPLDVHASAPLAIGDHLDDLIDLQRPVLALYIGGMGGRGRNFYNDLARRYGYENEAREIQDLYLSGKRREAESAVPEDLLRALSLIGTRSHVRERLEVYRSAGVSTINVRPVAPDPRHQLDDVAALRELLG